MAPAAGLYLHVPFCSAVCPYCDFAVRTGAPPAREAFVETLEAEMRLWRGRWLAPIDTVYLGGGTPSLLTPEQLARLLETARRELPVRSDAVVSLEANPEDVSATAVAAWRRLGIAVVSLGVQSFDDRELAFLGRRHRGHDARDAVSVCLEGGFATVSIDLMFGLPGQSAAAWGRSLAAAVELGPPHVSCYQLTVHEGTAFGRRRARGTLSEMVEDAQGMLFAQTHRVLAEHGWTAYEVSNFARAPEHRSAHNLKYWRHAPYLGLGPSAHSFDGRRRWWNRRGPRRYAAAVRAGERPIEGAEELRRDDLALEALMLGLRTVDGIDLSGYRAAYGVDLETANEPLLAILAAADLVVHEGGRLRPTTAGLAVADGLAARFRLG